MNLQSCCHVYLSSFQTSLLLHDFSPVISLASKNGDIIIKNSAGLCRTHTPKILKLRLHNYGLSQREACVW